MQENKKVKNAKKIEYDGIIFDSQLEVTCYKLLKENNINFSYNADRITIFEGFKLDKMVFYQPNKKRQFIINNRKILDSTYSPDFYIIHNNKNIDIYIETKGKENDVYPLKRKMFFKKMEEKGLQENKKIYFFEPHNNKQIKESIFTILDLIRDETN